jgi:hypothetical protein
MKGATAWRLRRHDVPRPAEPASRALEEGGRRKHRRPKAEERSERRVSGANATAMDERSESIGAPDSSASGLSRWYGREITRKHH